MLGVEKVVNDLQRSLNLTASRSSTAAHTSRDTVVRFLCYSSSDHTFLVLFVIMPSYALSGGNLAKEPS